MTSAGIEVVTSQDNAGRQAANEGEKKYVKSFKVDLLVSMTPEHPRMNTYVPCGLPQCRFQFGMNGFIWLHNEALFTS
jgi:hypothetical protein